MMQLVPFDKRHLNALFTWISKPEDLYECAATTFHYPLNREQFDGFPERFNAKAYWLMDMTQDHPIGMGDLVMDEERQEIRLARIIIDPKQRGRGFGKALSQLLVDEALNLLPNKNWSVSLWVLKENPVSRATYERIGFNYADEEIAFTAGAKTYPCIKMIWPHEKTES